MTYRDTAVEVVTRAEEALRSVITEALNAQAYREVATIAGIADQLALIARELERGHSASNGLPTPQVCELAHDNGASRPSLPTEVVTGETQGSNSGTPLKPQRYPHYVRDSEKLIKWAWSKKQRKPYEHRAPREIVHVLLDSIRKNKGEGKVFEASEVMPLTTNSGDEYPSYQVYLALGWLRHAGVVRKRGRAGYLLIRGTEASRIDALWQQLPQVHESV